MNIINCEMCKSMSQYSGYGKKLCSRCKEIENEDISKIKIYLQQYPNANVNIISKELEIPVRRLFYYIDVGTIEIKNSNKIRYCKRCSTIVPITEEYCQKCKNDLVKGFSKTTNISKIQESDSRMRYLRNL